LLRQYFVIEDFILARDRGSFSFSAFVCTLKHSSPTLIDEFFIPAVTPPLGNLVERLVVFVFVVVIDKTYSTVKK
jgi:hypothetical protein